MTTAAGWTDGDAAHAKHIRRKKNTDENTTDLKDTDERINAMKKIYLTALCFFLLSLNDTHAQQSVRFTDLPLSLSPAEMVGSLQSKGLQLTAQPGTSRAYTLTGRVAGMPVTIDVFCSRDTLRIEQMKLTTQDTRHSQRDIYHTLMKWMKQHYGEPNWDSSVRSLPFARWYMDFDRDIVMQATAKGAVEIWFYNNHQQRQFDYYAILKYCERNPVDSAPHLTARESVTWHSATVPTAKKKSSKRHLRKKASKTRKRGKTRRSRRHRR